MEYLPDYDYLTRYAQHLFPGSQVVVTYPAEEVIHIQIDTRLFVFEVGSDDEAYTFTNGHQTFEIPLMNQDFS